MNALFLKRYDKTKQYEIGTRADFLNYSTDKCQMIVLPLGSFSIEKYVIKGEVRYRLNSSYGKSYEVEKEVVVSIMISNFDNIVDTLALIKMGK